MHWSFGVASVGRESAVDEESPLFMGALGFLCMFPSSNGRKAVADSGGPTEAACCRLIRHSDFGTGAVFRIERGWTSKGCSWMSKMLMPRSLALYGLGFQAESS